MKLKNWLYRKCQ